MKLAPLSSDLMVKLAIGAGVILVLGYFAKRAADAAVGAGQGAARTAGQVADAVISAPVTVPNAVVSTITGRDETLGGWFYSATHADPVTMIPTPVPRTVNGGYDAMGNPTGGALFIDPPIRTGGGATGTW